MTLLDVYEMLGETFKEVHTSEAGTRAAKHTMEKAEYETKVAKQLINASDVILRTDKMCGKTDRITEIVG